MECFQDDQLSRLIRTPAFLMSARVAAASRSRFPMNSVCPACGFYAPLPNNIAIPLKAKKQAYLPSTFVPKPTVVQVFEFRIGYNNVLSVFEILRGHKAPHRCNTFGQHTRALSARRRARRGHKVNEKVAIRVDAIQPFPFATSITVQPGETLWIVRQSALNCL